jgi:two-component system, chemotaxis family, sensor kinase Cph1
VQVFQNLIGNAIKFRGSGAPMIHITAETKVKEWIFSVADNGIGIAPEHAENVFVIFRRLHTRAEYSGNGIGLSICKKIIEHPSPSLFFATRETDSISFMPSTNRMTK